MRLTPSIRSRVVPVVDDATSASSTDYAPERDDSARAETRRTLMSPMDVCARIWVVCSSAEGRVVSSSSLLTRPKLVEMSNQAATPSSTPISICP